MVSILSIVSTAGSNPWFQGEGPYSATSSFLTNYFFAGMGYWIYFLLIALAALIWVLYDSATRKLDAVGWRIALVVAFLLVVPSIFFKFSVMESQVDEYYDIKSQIKYLQVYQEPEDWRHMVDDLQSQLSQYPPLTGGLEPIMYMGVLGGLGALVLAVAYYITYQGQTGTSSSSSEAGAYAPPPPPAPVSRSSRPQRSPQGQKAAPPPPAKPKAHAWLVSQEGRSYQLNQGETTIGRSSQNDIQIGNDSTVSGSHAKIVEQNNHFRFFDLGSTNGSQVNGRMVREPLLLAPNDQIQLGDNTTLQFVTSQR